VDSVQLSDGVESKDPPKLFEIVSQWRIRGQFLIGLRDIGLRDDGVVIKDPIVRVLKEAEDVVIVETDEKFYLLDPPGQVTYGVGESK